MRWRIVVWSIVLLIAAIVLERGGISIRGVLSDDVVSSGTSEGAALDNLPVPIVSAQVREQDVPIYLFGLGTVQAFSTVRLNSRVDGQLQELFFSEGQDVRAGEPLAQIDPRPFQAALREVEANLRRDQAALAGARTELERLLVLATHEVTSQKSVDRQRALIAQLEATIDGDQAQIDNARVQLAYTLITSPIDGRAGLRLVDRGNMIRASDPLGIVVLTQLQPIAVIFALPEEELPRINERTGPALNVTALGRDGKSPLAEGQLVTIDNTIDRKTGTFKLKAEFANEAHRLWPGQFVNIRLHLATRRGGTVVPEAALQHGPQGNYVFVIEPSNTGASGAIAPNGAKASAIVPKADGTVVMRAVKVTETQEGGVLVDEGLSPGERVVVEGQSRLEPGAAVIEVKPEQAPAFGSPRTSSGPAAPKS